MWRSPEDDETGGRQRRLHMSRAACPADTDGMVPSGARQINKKQQELGRLTFDIEWSMGSKLEEVLKEIEPRVTLHRRHQRRERRTVWRHQFCY